MPAEKMQGAMGYFLKSLKMKVRKLSNWKQIEPAKGIARNSSQRYIKIINFQKTIEKERNIRVEDA
jgi:hypothetical protein